MLEKTKKFVSDHKTQIATAAVSAVVGGAAVVLYHKYGPKNYLILPEDFRHRLAGKPFEDWVYYNVRGTDIVLSAVPEALKNK